MTAELPMTLEFDGERLIPEKAEAYSFWEHVHRYRFATEFARGRSVLDIACGEGYGTAALAATARSVVGVDISPAADGTADVEAYLRALKHPLKKEIEAVRLIVLSASPKIGEGIKWNVPSFHTGEYFATFNVRSAASVQLVFHLGAKVRALPAKGLQIADPNGLLKWLAKDRAMAKFRDLEDIEAKRSAFADVIRQWIKYV